MNWILLTSQQHFLQRATLSSTLQLNETFPVLQTRDFWVFEHAPSPSPRILFLPPIHLTPIPASS